MYSIQNIFKILFLKVFNAVFWVDFESISNTFMIDIKN